MWDLTLRRISSSVHVLFFFMYVYCETLRYILWGLRYIARPTLRCETLRMISSSAGFFSVRNSFIDACWAYVRKCSYVTLLDCMLHTCSESLRCVLFHRNYVAIALTLWEFTDVVRLYVVRLYVARPTLRCETLRNVFCKSLRCVVIDLICYVVRSYVCIETCVKAGF